MGPIISRPRLSDGFFDSAQVVLVTAGAGYGKTTLLDPLGAGTPGPIGWLSLTADDNNPVVFSRHLSDVVQEMARQESLGSGMQLDAVAINDGIVNIPRPFCLFVDGYEVIHDSCVHDLMNAVIKDLPPSGAIAIASRSAVQLRLGRLRGQGRLRELDARDLRFTLEETGALLRKHLPSAPSEELVWHIWHASAGWAVGISLAGIAWSRSSAEGTEAQDHEAAWQAYVDDFVREEILDLLPDDDRRLALAIAWLPHLTSEALAAILHHEVPVPDIDDVSRAFPYIEQDVHADYRFVVQPLIGASLRRIASHEMTAVERQAIEVRTIH